MAVFHPRTRLDSFVEGVLSPSARARVSAHLADCAECRREVGQRERILRAASSLGPVPLSTPGSSPSGPRLDSGRPGYRSVPVLEHGEGVAGWKVVLGLGAVGLLASGVLAGAWIAGDPTAVEVASGQSPFLSVTGDSSRGAGIEGERSRAASTPPALSPSEEPDPGSASVPAALAPAGSILSSAAGASQESVAGADEAVAASGTTPATVLRLTPSMTTELRQAGWTVPTFHGLGMRNESTGWQVGEGVAEVVTTLADGGHTLEFHECRALRDEEPAPSCPVAWDRNGGSGRAPLTTGPLAGAGADVVQLPVGVDMYLRKHADGSWSAALSTAQAGYAVHSDLPVETAPRVMSMVVISERSRVQTAVGPDSPAERLARGFERLLPWAGVTESQRR